MDVFSHFLVSFLRSQYLKGFQLFLAMSFIILCIVLFLSVLLFLLSIWIFCFYGILKTVESIVLKKLKYVFQDKYQDKLLEYSRLCFWI